MTTRGLWHLFSMLVGMAMLVCGYSVSTLAAPAASPAPAAKKPAADTDYNVKMTADVLVYNEEKKLLVLDGNVTFTHLDTVITSPHAEFETEKQIGHFTGGVRVTQPGTTLTGDVLDAYYTESRAVVTGRAQLVTERAPSMDAGGAKKDDGAPLPPPPAPEVQAPSAKVAVAVPPVPKVPKTPVEVPTAVPSGLPTSVPVAVPTSVPVAVPTSVPVAVPTSVPVAVPTTGTVTVPTTVEIPTAVPATIPSPATVPVTRPSAAAGKPAPADEKRVEEPRTKPAEKLPTIMLADVMEYYWDKDEGDAIGNVKIRQGDKRAYSDRAHYQGSANQIRLFSNVRMERGENDSMISEEAIVDLVAQTFEARGGVEATVIVEQTPSPAPALTTPQGDRVLKPTPPTLHERPAPDGLPRGVLKTSGRTLPRGPVSGRAPSAR